MPCKIVAVAPEKYCLQLMCTVALWFVGDLLVMHLKLLCLNHPGVDHRYSTLDYLRDNPPANYDDLDFWVLGSPDTHIIVYKGAMLQVMKHKYHDQVELEVDRETLTEERRSELNVMQHAEG